MTAKQDVELRGYDDNLYQGIENTDSDLFPARQAQNQVVEKEVEKKSEIKQAFKPAAAIINDILEAEKKDLFDTRVIIKANPDFVHKPEKDMRIELRARELAESIITRVGKVIEVALSEVENSE